MLPRAFTGPTEVVTNKWTRGTDLQVDCNQKAWETTNKRERNGKISVLFV